MWRVGSVWTAKYLRNRRCWELFNREHGYFIFITLEECFQHTRKF